MSTPGLFVPAIFENEPVVDGGLLRNFPIDDILKSEEPYVALYLVQGREPVRWWLPGLLVNLVNTVLGRDESAEVDSQRRSVVTINAAPVCTTQFNLSPAEKEFLVSEGRAAALKYLAEHTDT